MSRRMFACVLIFSWCAALAFTWSASSADETAVERIEQALASPTEMEFVDTPLEEFRHFVSDRHQIPIVLDEKAIEEAGRSKTSAISINVRGVSLESALDLILAQLEMDYVIGKEVLLFTSQEAAGNHHDIKVYPVGDLLEPSLDGFQTGPNQLVELITRSIIPESWDEVGGPGTLSLAPGSKSLVCVNHRRVHKKLAKLLEELRAARTKQETAQAASPEELVLRIYRLPAINQQAGNGGGSTPLDADTTAALAEAIEATVDPESWEKGSISTAGNALFVRQTPGVHAKLRAALTVFAMGNSQIQTGNGFFRVQE